MVYLNCINSGIYKHHLTCFILIKVPSFWFMLPLLSPQQFTEPSNHNRISWQSKSKTKKVVELPYLSSGLDSCGSDESLIISSSSSASMTYHCRCV